MRLDALFSLAIQFMAMRHGFRIFAGWNFGQFGSAQMRHLIGSKKQPVMRDIRPGILVVACGKIVDCSGCIVFFLYKNDGNSGFAYYASTQQPASLPR